MKKLSIILSILFFFLFPLFVFAQTNHYALDVYIPADQTINDNFVRAANSFDIRGNIKGDVVVVGANVDISGRVEGDVLAAASNIKISGEVLGNVRVAGAAVDIEGKVGKNVNVFSGTVNFGLNSEILGDVSVYSGTADFKGKVEGNIYGRTGRVTISGKLNKNVELHFDGEEKGDEASLVIFKEAEIQGDLNYYSRSQAKIDEEAVIKGQVNKYTPKVVGKAARKFINSFWLFSRLVSFFGLIVVALILIWFFDDRTKKITERMLKKPGQSMLFGLGILFLVPIISIMLMITIIGAPLGIIILLLYILAIYLSTIFVGLTIGRQILAYFQKKKFPEVSSFWSLIIGLLIYLIIVDLVLWSGSILGIFGGVIKFLALIWALGGIFFFERKIKEKK